MKVSPDLRCNVQRVGMAKELRFRGVLVHVPLLAIETIRRVVRGGGGLVPEAARVVERVAEANDILCNGGFARLLQTISQEELEELLAAMASIGAHDARAALEEAAALQRSGGATVAEIERLDRRFDDHEPPLLGLLVEYIGVHADPWFEDLAKQSPLVSAMARVDRQEVLRQVVRLGHVPCVMQALVDTGAGAQLLDDVHLLHLAVRQRPTPSRVKVARMVLDAGADVNARDEYGRAPLHDAAERGGPAFVELLLSRGAGPNAASPGGSTALHSAESAESVRLLLNAGAEANARTQDGRTPLHVARSTAKVKLLLDARADPRARDDSGASTLHHPMDAEAIKLLAAAGVDVNAADDVGRTPLMLQRDGGPIEALLELGARIDVVDQDGRNVLHHHRGDCLELLLRRGADPTVRDRDGRTPLDVARENPMCSLNQLAILDAATRP